VTEWLTHHAGVAEPLTFTRIGGGHSNLTFRVVDAHGRCTVLRRPPIGEALATAHDMEREYRTISGLHRAGQRVPAPLALCQDPDITGAPFYLMQQVDGTVLLDREAAEAMPSEARARAGLTLAQTLADLQRVDLGDPGLAHLRRSTPYMARQIRRWHGQWTASQTRDLPEVDDLATRLTQGAPPAGDDVLLHGDYRLDNLILRDDGTVAAVLDWELCTAGPPLADVGLALAYWEEAATPSGMFATAVTSLRGFPTLHELVGAYAQASGRDLTDVDYYVALAFWKITIIVEGVYRRWLTDPANGAATAGSLGAMVPRLAQRAAEAAVHAGI
jgi:aminoglycoside phosphotransferase (APT) family kinase protein